MIDYALQPGSSPQPYFQPMPPVSQFNQFGYQAPAPPSDTQFQPGQGYGMAMPGNIISLKRSLSPEKFSLIDSLIH